MTSSQDPPNGVTQQQSALSEAVEQLADSADKWSGDIAEFLKQQADRLAAGDYGLNDLVTAPVKLMSIWVKDTFDTVFAISDNLAVLSDPRSGAAPRPRTVRVPVTIPANVDVELVASNMEGQSGHSIPSSDMRIEPDKLARSPEESQINVVVTVKSSRVPNDTYAGFLRSKDQAIKEVSFGFAINELGEPVR